MGKDPTGQGRVPHVEVEVRKSTVWWGTRKNTTAGEGRPLLRSNVLVEADTSPIRLVL